MTTHSSKTKEPAPAAPKFYSRHDIDKIIYSNYINQPAKDGTFIELGAHDGIHCSNTKFLEDHLGFSGLLIEAVPHLFDKLIINRSPKNIFRQGAVTTSSSEYIEFLGNNAVAGLPHAMSTSHKTAWHSKAMKSHHYQVKTLRLDNLLRAGNINHVDFFSLDVEGAELEVLLTMDWSIPVYLLLVEANSGDEEKSTACRRLAEENGMTYERNIGNNMLFVDKRSERAQILFKAHQGNATHTTLHPSRTPAPPSQNPEGSEINSERPKNLSKNLIISFFGASVTAQGESRNGEVNGYFSHIKKNNSLGNRVELRKHAYGSNQFYAIGKYELATVLQEKPDVLFFEWHTTGEESHSVDQWQASVELCKTCGCIPIILVLPKINADPTSQKYQILDILKDEALILDIRQLTGDNLNELLRDGAHTNPKGGAFYADVISDFIKSKLLHTAFKNAEAQAKVSPWLAPVFYSHKMKKIAYNKLQLCQQISHKNSLAILNPSRFDAEYGFWGTKGPTTANAFVRSSASTKEVKLDCMDQWCFYSRSSLLFKVTVPAGETLSITSRGDLATLINVCPKAFEQPYADNLPKDNEGFTLSILDVYYPINSLPVFTFFP
jgi:FkbM family methyltransferase